MKRAAASLLLGCALALGACSQEEPEQETELVAPAPQREPGEWLAEVERAHASADTALAAGHPADASAALRAALELAVPQGVASDHARVVQQDLWYRLATIDLASAPAQALLEADRGLALGRGADLFSSNLLTARGRALAALGRDTEAASSYHEALAIDERLLQAALGKGQAGGP
jgi:hypothetical protein